MLSLKTILYSTIRKSHHVDAIKPLGVNFCAQCRSLQTATSRSDPLSCSTRLSLTNALLVDQSTISPIATNILSRGIVDSLLKNDPLVYVSTRNLSSSSKFNKSDDDDDNKEDKKLSIFQRYKKAYKEYGKILVGVHIATSLVWYGSFYYVAASGVDVLSLLQWVGAGETVISAFGNPAYGNLAVAYLLYKVATPARYTLTIGGTHWTVKQLRKRGCLQPRNEKDNIRNLVIASTEKVKDRARGVRCRLASRRGDINNRAKTTLYGLTRSAKNRARSMSTQVRVRANKLTSKYNKKD